MAAAAEKEMQGDEHRAKEGENQEQEWKEGRKAKGSSLVTPQVFHPVIYGLHKGEEMTHH